MKIDEAIKLVSIFPDDLEHIVECQDARAKIIEELTSEQQWIPVSERLPKIGETVLWCNKKGNVFCSCITYQQDNWFYVGKHGNKGCILAWMPLPEAYRTEEK